MESRNEEIKALPLKKDSKTLAREARAWVASQEGQRQIEEALIEAQQVTFELNKSQEIEVGNFRVPFAL